MALTPTITQGEREKRGSAVPTYVVIALRQSARTEVRGSLRLGRSVVLLGFDPHPGHIPARK